MTGITKKGSKGFQSKLGGFTPSDVKKRHDKVAKEYGFSDEIKKPKDYIEVLDEALIKSKLKQENEKTDEWGLTKDFYKFLGIPQGYGKDYRIPLGDGIKEKFESITSDFQSYYTPLDDFYGTPGGGDYVYDYGRIPVSHLVVMCTQRLGVAHRGCYSVAKDAFRNRFSFVNYDDPDKEIKTPEIMTILKWMNQTHLWDHITDTVYFERMTGLGHLIGYYRGEKGVERMDKSAPRTRPIDFDAFSCYYMTPMNIFDNARLDYNKSKWDYIGGVPTQTTIHHSRVHVLETRKVEGGLRGIAIPELCWIPLICYLNTCYYILRSLSQLGTVLVGATVAQEYPSAELTQKYLDLFAKMRANKFYIFGKNMDFKLMNAAGKIGEGIDSYLEFLREDISSAWIIPKNQLFGRAEGGGLEGAGALVSKEDYLASNLSTLQMDITDDIMDILQNMCHFPDLGNVTLRWNLDLHKTEQQRLTEQLMREQLEQAKVQTKMVKIQKKLMGMQYEQAMMQFEQFKKNPQLLLPPQGQGNEQGQGKGEKVEKKVNEDQKITPERTKTVRTGKPEKAVRNKPVKGIQDFDNIDWIQESLENQRFMEIMMHNKNFFKERMDEWNETMDRLRERSERLQKQIENSPSYMYQRKDFDKKVKK